jgi:hypothetical protein
MRINVVITLEALVDRLAHGIRASGLVQRREYALVLAQEICGAMGFDCAPTDEIRVDCGELWLQCFAFHQRYETTTAREPYSELARTTVREVMSASLAAGCR